MIHKGILVKAKSIITSDKLLINSNQPNKRI
jgi:hypothetical protein